MANIDTSNELVHDLIAFYNHYLGLCDTAKTHPDLTSTKVLQELRQLKPLTLKGESADEAVDKRNADIARILQKGELSWKDLFKVAGSSEINKTKLFAMLYKVVRQFSGLQMKDDVPGMSREQLEKSKAQLRSSFLATASEAFPEAFNKLKKAEEEFKTSKKWTAERANDVSIRVAELRKLSQDITTEASKIEQLKATLPYVGKYLSEDTEREKRQGVEAKAKAAIAALEERQQMLGELESTAVRGLKRAKEAMREAYGDELASWQRSKEMRSMVDQTIASEIGGAAVTSAMCMNLEPESTFMQKEGALMQEEAAAMAQLASAKNVMKKSVAHGTVAWQKTLEEWQHDSAFQAAQSAFRAEEKFQEDAAAAEREFDIEFDKDASRKGATLDGKGRSLQEMLTKIEELNAEFSGKSPSASTTPVATPSDSSDELMLALLRKPTGAQYDSDITRKRDEQVSPISIPDSTAPLSASPTPTSAPLSTSPTPILSRPDTTSPQAGQRSSSPPATSSSPSRPATTSPGADKRSSPAAPISRPASVPARISKKDTSRRTVPSPRTPSAPPAATSKIRFLGGTEPGKAGSRTKKGGKSVPEPEVVSRKLGRK